MNILLFPNHWFGCNNPVAGGESFLNYLCQYLIKQGHTVKSCHLTDTEYTHENIQCYPQGKMQMWQVANNDLCEWADIIVTQLNGTNMAYNKAKQHNKPLMFIAHNTVKSYVIRYSNNCHVLYNSEYVKNEVHPHWDLPNMVCTPPIDYRNWQRSTRGKYITLVNCNEAKGGGIFVELAKELPDLQFIGVKGGYGEQITEDLPNLTYIENGSRNMQDIYNDTRILLQPSSFETYGQAVLEAMCCGVPVIAHPTMGLQECIGTGGQYADRNNLQEYKEKILALGSNWQYWSDKAFERAVELEPTEILKEVEKWMEDIIKKHGKENNSNNTT